MKDRWSQLSMSEKSDLMSLYIRNGISSLEEIKKHYNSFATGGALPDHDPDNPYHYHDTAGNKVVITPEDWETNVGKPYFKEIEDAVRAEQAAYPGPEYEVNPNFVRDLRSTYGYNMGNSYQNYRNFSSSLPKGYNFTDEGLIIDSQGNYYVQSGYRQSPRFTYNTNNPLQFTVNQGKPIERNLTFYPVNMDKRVKAPIPIDRILNINNERESAIQYYINNNNKAVQMYRTPWFRSGSDPVIYVYGTPDALSSGLYGNNQPVNHKKGTKSWYGFHEFQNDADEAEQFSASNLITEQELKQALFNTPTWINGLFSDPDFWKDDVKYYKPSRQEAKQKAVIPLP